jgi:LysM repeat protein
MKYEVKSGDSLSKIARSFNMDYKELARLNKIADPDKIRIGQVISIPTKDMKTQVENAQQQRPTTRGTTRRQARPEPKPEPKPEPRPEPKPEPKKS